MPTHINIIGAGQLGKTLGRAISTLPHYTILGICNRTPESTLKAIDFIGEGKAYTHIHELPKADITFITTTDSEIKKVALALSQSPSLQKESLIAHASGVLNASILSPLKLKQCHTASIHPMRSFACPESTDFHRAYCAMEGDEKAKKELKILYEQLGAIVYTIKPDKKGLYHASGTFASNYLITLCSLASGFLEEAGIAKDESLAITLDLMKGSLENIGHTASIKKSLTGPLARGDLETISTHLQSLNEETKALYCALAKMTIPLTSLDDMQKKCLIDRLK